MEREPLNLENEEQLQDEELDFELDLSEQDDESVDYKALYEESEEKRRKLYARVKDTQSKLKNTPVQKDSKKDIPLQQPNMDRDEIIAISVLTAKDYSEDEINYIGKIAKVEGISLLSAEKTDLFQAYKEKRENEMRAEKAKLSASRSGSRSQQQKDFSTPGLTAEEHKRLFMERNS